MKYDKELEKELETGDQIRDEDEEFFFSIYLSQTINSGV